MIGLRMNHGCVVNAKPLAAVRVRFTHTSWTLSMSSIWNLNATQMCSTTATVIPLSHLLHPLSHIIIVLLFLRTVVLHQQKHIYSRHLPRSTNLGSASDSLPVKGRNWQTLVLNANSIAGKAAEFACLVDNKKPDVIIMTETKLGERAHFSSEFMPPGYSSPIRKDTVKRQVAEASLLASEIAMLYLMSRYPSLTLSQCGQKCHCGTSINRLLAVFIDRQQMTRTVSLHNLPILALSCIV